jgi:hypothetical protein
MEGTQVSLASEYIKLGSGGAEPPMLMSALNTRDMDAFRDEIELKRAAQFTHAPGSHWGRQLDGLLHPIGQRD